MTQNSPEEILNELIDAIERQDAVETLILQKNASVEGRTSSHPIDLYWEFTDGDLVYKTLISAEHLNTVATRSDIIKMAGSIRDIHGQATGVLFTRPVYDASVAAMANNIGITLVELLPPLPPEWQSVVENLDLQADEAFIQQEKARLGITEKIAVNVHDPKQVFFYNQNFACVDTVDSVIASYVKRAQPAGFGKQKIAHVFPEATYLQTGNELMPFLKILSISFTLSFKEVIHLDEEDRQKEGMDMVIIILKNIARYIR